ncbi:YcbK family protein [Burkholderia vietnamiensis]|uniref:YcbK family protein n=1 Tax=Burkholderia vietnamiensis TaxID=60552 RepID=UPI0015930A0C|nr:DUF882 domain-containing protein [Burkholderia vietnamiensis]
MNRREFLARWAAAGSALLVPTLARADFESPVGRRTLWLRRPESGDSFRVAYWIDGGLDRDNYLRLCYVLRDAQEAQMTFIKPRLLHLLYAIQVYSDHLTGFQSPIDILSGYRTRYHNAHTEGAVFNSRHLVGEAADIRRRGMTPGAMGQLALNLGVGGVGQYDTFTHVDVGPVRTWAGTRGAATRQ